MSTPQSPGHSILKRRDTDTRLSTFQDTTPVSPVRQDVVDESSGRPKGVQFSPSKNSVTKVIETHSAEIYDRSPCGFTPLSPEELQDEQSPMRFLGPARLKVIQDHQTNHVGAAHSAQSVGHSMVTGNARNRRRNEVIVEEDDDEGNDVATPPSHVKTTPQFMAAAGSLVKSGNAGYFLQTACSNKASRIGNSRELIQVMDDFFSPQKSSEPYGKYKLRTYSG